MRTVPVMIPLLLFGLGCVHRDDPVVSGDVQVTSDGSTQVRASACLDAGFLDCKGATTMLELHHDGTATPMPYDGFLFPDHHCVAPLGNPAKEFDVTNNFVHARMTLPPPFDLASTLDGETLAASATLHLAWQPGDSPMRWDADYDCATSGFGGAAVGGSVDDGDGTLAIEGTRLVEIIGKDHVADGCTVTIEVLRVLEGDMDKQFPATLATGIQSRTLTFRLVP